MHGEFKRQLEGYRLTTAEILYHMPDHPAILQSFVWQLLDRVPDFPKLVEFLEFWTHNLDGKLHSVTVAHADPVTPGGMRHVDLSHRIH